MKRSKQELMDSSPEAEVPALHRRAEDFEFLATTNCRTVGCYPLQALDRAMEAIGMRCKVNPQSAGEEFVGKVLSKFRMIRNVHRSKPLIVSFMGFSEYKTFPVSCWTELVPYCFDCWPGSYDRWSSFFKRHRVRVAFFSARQSAEHFLTSIPAMQSFWLPEATDPNEYDPETPLSARDIDVLELGRREEAYHRAIVDSLAKQGRSHRFEAIKGQIIFPSKDELIDGLSRAKISICFPCSQTHPERSGDVETVTHRYFESIASKCVIVGHSPAELVDLFGYNPVIEVETGNEATQIEFILEHLNSFQGLVDRNYARLLECGTWKHRVTAMLRTLREHDVHSATINR